MDIIFGKDNNVNAVGGGDETPPNGNSGDNACMARPNTVRENKRILQLQAHEIENLELVAENQSLRLQIGLLQRKRVNQMLRGMEQRQHRDPRHGNDATAGVSQAGQGTPSPVEGAVAQKVAQRQRPARAGLVDYESPSAAAATGATGVPVGVSAGVPMGVPVGVPMAPNVTRRRMCPAGLEDAESPPPSAIMDAADLPVGVPVLVPKVARRLRPARAGLLADSESPPPPPPATGAAGLPKSKAPWAPGFSRNRHGGYWHNHRAIVEVGAEILVHSLAGERGASYNGEEGVVISVTQMTGRACVRLNNLSQETFNIKPQNLQVLSSWTKPNAGRGCNNPGNEQRKDDTAARCSTNDNIADEHMVPDYSGNQRKRTVAELRWKRARMAGWRTASNTPFRAAAQMQEDAGGC